MPQGAAPRALLGVIALIMAIAVAVVPVVDARPKDKKGGNEETVTTESPPPTDASQSDVVVVDPASVDPGVAQTVDDQGAANSNERTLLSSDADGDYLPDALDNCPNVQNPDQADADGDGIGDACPVYSDYDGDGVADKEDNCPNIATYDFADRDGDGVGDACDKSPDGIEPEPEPLPNYDGQGGEGAEDLAAPENGAGEDGTAYEREGKSRSKERSRTDNSKPIITTGSDETQAQDGQQDGTGGDGEVITEGPDAVPYEEPARDNPRRNEELVAEAAASGELYAPPEPPPPAQKAWDEEDAGTVEWTPVVRIDAGATADAVAGNAAARSSRDEQARRVSDAADEEVGDSGLARGWMRARVLLQDEATVDPDPGDVQSNQGPVPVPVENGLVITSDNTSDDTTAEPLDEQADDTANTAPDAGDGQKADNAKRDGPPEKRDARDDSASNKDGSRRAGSSRAAAAATERPRDDGGASANAENTSASRANASDNGSANARERKKDRAKKRRQRAAQRSGQEDTRWSEDRYFDGGSALDWSGDIDVAGTDEEEIYLTQRSGTGTGKRRGFSYAIPVENTGSYLVRLYFAEPYWGSPDGPAGEAGKRVFSVAAEGDDLFTDLDVYAEAGAMSALVKQAEVRVDDGELNLQFTASEGEPIIAAIEVLEPAQ